MSPRCPTCNRVPVDNPAPGWFYCGRCGESYQRKAKSTMKSTTPATLTMTVNGNPSPETVRALAEAGRAAREQVKELEATDEKRLEVITRYGTQLAEVRDSYNLLRAENARLMAALDKAAQQAQAIVDNHDDLKKRGNELQLLAIAIRETCDAQLAAAKS